MTPALEKEIPVKICNAKQPKEPGTMISPSPEPCTNLIKSITYKNQMILLHLRPKDQIKPSQFIQNVLDLFDREGIIPYILNTAVEKISMVVDSTIRGEHVIKQIQKDMIVKVKTGKATISLIGDKLQNHPTIATEICTLLNPTPIDLFSHGTSPINFTMVVNEKEVARIITSLHDYFFKQLDSKRFT